MKKHQQELAKISGEIAWYEQEARNKVVLALQYKLEIGKRLAQAKLLIPHGRFLSWARAEFGWTPRHVQNHLKLAANAKRVSLLGPGASMRMALAAIEEALPAEPREEVAPEGSRTGESLALTPSVRRIRLTGEIEEGALDCERLVSELERIAAALGATKTKWRVFP